MGVQTSQTCCCKCSPRLIDKVSVPARRGERAQRRGSRGANLGDPRSQERHLSTKRFSRPSQYGLTSTCGPLYDSDKLPVLGTLNSHHPSQSSDSLARLGEELGTRTGACLQLCPLFPSYSYSAAARGAGRSRKTRFPCPC